jgi:hypothetical protein
MYLDSKTRQRLLELVYDALPDDEAAALWRQIETDSEMARAYADARRTAGLIADAARIPAPQIERTRREHVSAVAASPRTKAAARAALRRRPPGGRGAGLAVGSSTAILLLVAIGTLFAQRGQWAELAAEHLRLLVTGPARIQAGTANHYSLLTTAVTGDPVSAQVEMAISAGNGKQLLFQKAWTDRSGRLDLAVPADAHFPARVQLNISAVYRGKTESVGMPLDVEPIHSATHLFLDKPQYAAGDSVYYRSTTLARFSLAAVAEFPLQFEILDPGGVAIPGSSLLGMTEQGVGNGSFRLPENLAAGSYRLIAKRPGASLPESQRTFSVQPRPGSRLKTDLELARDHYLPGESVVADFSAREMGGGPLAAANLEITAVAGGQNVFRSSLKTSTSGTAKIRFPLPEKIEHPGEAWLAITVERGAARETIRRDIPLDGGVVSVAFYPEGGELVAGLENRVYFSARDGRGRPIEVRGSVVDDRGNEILDVETSYRGMGLFTLSPNSGEHYRLKITSPAGIQQQPRLSDKIAEHGVLLTTGPGVFDAGQPLQVNVQSLRANLPLVVAASCRGTPVGQYAFVAGASGNRLTLPLPAEVAGVIRLTVYDYRRTPPQPLAQRLVYRRAGRRLQIRMGDDRPWYTPGEKVNVSLSVANERGQPLPATLGVAVADAALAAPGDGELAPWLLAEALDPAQDREDADFFLSEGAQASLALDLLLGTRGAPRLAESALGPSPATADDLPPAISDNLSQIRAKYEESLGRYRAQRSWIPDTLTIVSFFGGFGLVLLVALMAILNVITRMWIWLPALIAAVACLIIGAILMNPDRFGEKRAGAVAFQSFRLPLCGDKAADSPTASQGDATTGKQGALATGRRADQGTGKAGNKENLPPSRSASAAPLPVSPSRISPFPICQYSHGSSVAAGAIAGLPGSAAVPRMDKPPVAPGDSAATLAWYPLVAAGADGRAQIAFELPGIAATYRLRAAAHGGGRLGVVETEIRSRLPLALQAKLPDELSAGDRIDALVTVLNQTAQTLPAELSVVHGKLFAADGNVAQRKIDIPGQQQVRQYVALHAVGPAGACPIEFRAVAGAFSDSLTRTLRIVAPGVPVERAYSGLLEGSSDVTVELPPQWERGSLQVALIALPTVLAELRQAADRLAGEPAIGLEQVISANFVNTLILQYLEEERCAAPDAMKQAKERLRSGLEKLAAIESPQGGLAAIHGGPVDESLSAYGLMQLSLASRVYDVDRPLMDRIAAWLLRRSDGMGGFRRNESAPNSTCPPETDLVNAYITWALAAYGEKALTSELQKTRDAGQISDSPYVVALAALGLFGAGHGDETGKLLEKLARAQQSDGHLNADSESKIPNQGRYLEVEATALAALAWAGSPGVVGPADRAIAWLAGKRDGSGGFGSARATVLSLRAISGYARRNRRSVPAGKLGVKHHGHLIAEQSFDADCQEPIVLDGLESQFVPGKNQVTLSLAHGGKMPYVLAVTYHLRQNASQSQCPIRLTTSLLPSQVKAGGRLTLSAEIANPTEIEQPLTIAVLGVPAGLEVPPERLEQLRLSGAIDAYRIQARQVVCGWRTMAAARQVSLKLDLTAVVPGQFTAPPSCVYLYQTGEDKCWVDPLSVIISRQ